MANVAIVECCRVTGNKHASPRPVGANRMARPFGPARLIRVQACQIVVLVSDDLDADGQAVRQPDRRNGRGQVIPAGIARPEELIDDSSPLIKSAPSDSLVP